MKNARVPAGKRIGYGFTAAAVAGLLSCATVTTIPEAEQPLALGVEDGRLARPGEVPYAVETGTRRGEFALPVLYEVYRPAQPRSAALVLLAHGFLRDLSSMRGWAALWASHGVTVTVASLPNSTWFNGRHERNAADLRALSRALHEGPVLYAGFSAGGLAALLAASQDPSAVSYLGLDPVDSGGLAGQAARAFTRPALILLGEPSSCNARNNILEALAPGASRPEMSLLRVRHATHCAFENPTDPRCDRICDSVQPAEAAAKILETIRCLATAWVLSSTGADPAAGAAPEEAHRGAGAWPGRVVIP